MREFSHSLGHEDPFPPHQLKARCPFSYGPSPDAPLWLGRADRSRSSDEQNRGVPQKAVMRPTLASLIVPIDNLWWLVPVAV